MYYRRKIILALLQTFNRAIPRTDFQKLLFLSTQKQTKPSFDFVPYKYGGFSFQSFVDKRTMTKYELLCDTDPWKKKDSIDYFSLLNKEDQLILREIKERFGNMTKNDLIRYVYLNYPYYAINSEIVHKHLSKEERQKIEKYRPKQDTISLFSMGYEGRSLENFINELVKNNIHLVCDIRKNPLSMKYGFSKQQLQDSLKKLHIQYLHFPSLGIESSERQQLETQQDYDVLFEHYEKTTLAKETETLHKVYTTWLTNKRMVLLCFERDYQQCHRSRVFEALKKIDKNNHEFVHLSL